MHSLGKNGDEIQGFSLPRERVLHLRLPAEKKKSKSFYLDFESNLWKGYKILMGAF